MNLENIGFYTLSDVRVKQLHAHSPLWRCELILTDRCNFKCPYCRGIEDENKGNMSWEKAEYTVRMWGANNLKNVRFSGGEPTMWSVTDKKGKKRNLVDLVKLAKDVGIERIAISTNGSIRTDFYLSLLEAGVNDLSISLDACCSEVGDKMSGGINGSWSKVIENIRILSKLTYVTVGVVFTPDNVQEFTELIKFADSLGVADIRILSSAQWNKAFDGVVLDQELLNRHPILKYRMTNVDGNRHVRGLRESDSHKCWLMLDDMAVLNGKHYPCIIYMREQGEAVGKIPFDISVERGIESVREDRIFWINTHDTHADPICKANCLDVCVDYNNRVESLRGCK